MTDRLNKIFEILPPCEVFADIGCDHGYIAKAMIESGRCERVIISDISAKCLQKAEKLLSKHLQNGVAKSVVSNGFDEIDGCDVGLIAGMGGEEISDIILRANSQGKLPETLVIQPMKNCDKARLTALSVGYAFFYDKVFKSAGKFYNLIVLKKGKDSLTEEEIEFGRDNIKLLHSDFTQMNREILDKLNALISDKKLSAEVKLSVEKKIEKIKKYV